MRFIFPGITIFTPWKQLRTKVPLVIHHVRRMKTFKSWAMKQSGSNPLLFPFAHHRHYSFTVPVPFSLYPISPCPHESTRLRKTGTIWKQNWHHCHCKQWNHMRVDSHWTFTPSPRAYTVLLRMFTARRWLWFHANIMHTGNQQQKEWFEKNLS